eukprot:2638955-Pyramimonas_sp.AAC.1
MRASAHLRLRIHYTKITEVIPLMQRHSPDRGSLQLLNILSDGTVQPVGSLTCQCQRQCRMSTVGSKSLIFFFYVFLFGTSGIVNSELSISMSFQESLGENPKTLKTLKT